MQINKAMRGLPAPDPGQEIVRIPLTRGLFAIIDAADYQLVSGNKWYADTSRGPCYAAHRVGKKIEKMHMTIMGCKGIDHRDGNGLNNRRYNLRIATQMQNVSNQRIHRDNRSGFKGIYLHRASGLWHARICKNYRTLDLGYYHSAKEAANAYDAAALETFGEFARLNFVGRMSAAVQACPHEADTKRTGKHPGRPQPE